MSPLRIGTRGSALALWQARTVSALLEAAGFPAELVIIKTAGDRLQQRPLSEIGGKRLFVKEIEDALLRGDIDVAVHSAKDMPAVLPDGLDVAATLPREDPRDAIVLPERLDGGSDLRQTLSHLGETATIGTGSVRRIAQLTALLPRATFAPIRGNVDTRLRKLDAGEYDALVLAAAGMKRLGFGGRISAPIPLDDCVPAPGQGIVAVEIRADDDGTREKLQGLNDSSAAIALNAERAVVAALDGGCQLPLGAIAWSQGEVLHMQGVVASPDGRRVARARASGRPSEAEAVGRRLAAILIEEGARGILDTLQNI